MRLTSAAGCPRCCRRRPSVNNVIMSPSLNSEENQPIGRPIKGGGGGSSRLLSLLLLFLLLSFNNCSSLHAQVISTVFSSTASDLHNTNQDQTYHIEDTQHQASAAPRTPPTATTTTTTTTTTSQLQANHNQNYQNSINYLNLTPANGDFVINGAHQQQVNKQQQQHDTTTAISNQIRRQQIALSQPTALYPFAKKYAILGNSSLSASAPSSSLATKGQLYHLHGHGSKWPIGGGHKPLAIQQQLNTVSQQQQHQHQLAASGGGVSIGAEQQPQQQQQQQLGSSNYNTQLIDQQQPSHQKRAGLLEKICIGTSNRMSAQHNKSDHYQNLVERYRNCTYVIGNLEITWLDKGSSSSSSSNNNDHYHELDLSFLESIREITGYLLIAYVDVERIRMPNLQIIRGRDLFKLNTDEKEEFALIMIENELRQLELPNLREILSGSVGSYNNRNLCHIRTINWDEILNWPMYRSVFVYNGTEPECPPCEPSCQGSCWGEGAEMCQKFSKVTCSPACGNNGRCFGPTHYECCNSFCAGGCTGSNQTDCLACKNFYDDGSCIQECPSMMRYNPSKFLWEPNPNGKYAFGATCVKECPEHMLRDSGACVRVCPPNKRSFSGECVPCGGPCPKNCQGVEVVHSGNIDQLINCTVIEGSITILDESFSGYSDTSSQSHQQQASRSSSSSSPSSNSATSQQATVRSASNSSPSLALEAAVSGGGGGAGGLITPTATNNSPANGSASSANIILRHKPMHPNRLEVFKTLREITGYLRIEAKHPDFKDLSYFTNLKTIDGRQTTDMFHALSITRTSLVSLNLRSLRKIRSGKIIIEDNPELCFADTIDWLQIDINRRDDVSIRNNAEQSKCRSVGLHCHEQCARDGCWGPGPDECLSCNNYKLDDYCVVNCSAATEALGFLAYEDLTTDSRICKRCHPECHLGCSGTEARHCLQCKSVKDGPYCVPECPSHKYNNNGTCDECDKSCADGCTGPSNKLGEGGCNSCSKAIIKSLGAASNDQTLSQHSHYQITCIRADEPCPDGFYQEYVVAGTSTSASSSTPSSSSSSSSVSVAPIVQQSSSSGNIENNANNNPLKVAAGRPVCRKCHHRCKRCIGMGTHKTVCECAKYVAGEQCEDFCPRDYYADEESRQCVKCSPECNGCFGPTEADCISCRVYRIYYDSISSSSSPTIGQTMASISADVPSSLAHSSSKGQLKFNCTAQCPSDKPHRISESNMLDPYCSEDAGIDIDSPLIMSMGSSTILCLLVIITAFMFCVSIYRCQIEKDKTVKLTMHLSGLDDIEPLNPSNVKPNLAPLNIIKETQLRRGKVLGSGFGGTVYQGFWYPESNSINNQNHHHHQDDQHQPPRPVAIKVLRENGHPNMNKEFLDEAYIMATVNHPNLVRLLGVCMTPKDLMIVTRLMPLGCLLDYVQKNKSEIGAKNLLEWGKQIASGMAYLEEHRMVHRDLALRNVLLQTSGRARISDFGLAKFLEVNQSEYHSGGGKLPIRWLAPECIRERKFTHKSDVWAFGVTIWELVTFGAPPFEEYKTCDVPMAIETGARLQQPNYVTAEVYMVMIGCWFYNPDKRPDFKSLVKEFAKFARDPERYLICGQTKGFELLTNKSNSKAIDGGGGGGGSSSKYSESDNCEDYSSGIDSDDDKAQTTPGSSQPPLSAMPDLTPSTHNRLNEMKFGFELRHNQQHQHQQPHRNSESEATTHNGNLTTPILKKFGLFNSNHDHRSRTIEENEVFVKPTTNSQRNHHHLAPVKTTSNNIISITDANNNNLIANNNSNSCWSMHHTISTNSLGQRSEQPTDGYDYLLPSPLTDVNRHAFNNFCHPGSYDDRTIPVTPTSIRNPPSSAGLANATNYEYFRTRTSYVNQEHDQESHNLSTSNGNIPQSLV